MQTIYSIMEWLTQSETLRVLSCHNILKQIANVSLTPKIFIVNIFVCQHCNWLTVLYRAATLCHFEALQVLSAYGANFTIVNSDQQTAMHLTLPSSNLVCIRFLGQRGDNDIHNLLRIG